jgi:MYXO-CTERM domain-containing protein
MAEVASTTSLGAVAATYASGALVIAASDASGALGGYRVDPSQPSQVAKYAWSSGPSYTPSLAFDGQNVIVAWSDAQSGAANVHALAFDPSDLSSGAAISPFAESIEGAPVVASRGAGHALVGASRSLPMRVGAGAAALQSVVVPPDAGADSGSNDQDAAVLDAGSTDAGEDAGKPSTMHDAGSIAHGDAGAEADAAPAATPNANGDDGGCGCVIVSGGSDGRSIGGGIAGLALAMVAARRRRAKR